MIGKTLVSIETPEEDKLVLNLLRVVSLYRSQAERVNDLRISNSPFNMVADVTDLIWTSGNNANYKFGWRWGTDEALFHTRWATTHPEYDTNNRCLALYSDQYDRFWLSPPCSNAYLPLCETVALRHSCEGGRQQQRSVTDSGW